MISLTKTVCLVLTPFAADFEPVQEVIRDAIKSYNRSVNMIRPDDELPDSFSILRVIEKADLIMADITGEDANIMYELGLAHGLKKPVMLLVQKEKGHVPSALRGHLFYVYDPKKVKELRPIIHHWLNRTLSEVGGTR
jgi:predicted nucleotide-binding protein